MSMTSNQPAFLICILVSGILGVTLPAQCWAPQPNAPVAYSAASAAALGGRIYLAGGHDGATDRNNLSSYDPTTGSWSSHAAMPQGRYETSGAVAFGGKVWVVGGWTTSPGLPHNQVFAYDPATNSWSNPTNLPVLSGCGVTAEIGGKLYVATPCDGYSGYRRFLHAFDPASNTWTQLANSLFEHVDPAAGAINGSFYVAGGVSIAGIHGNLERFDPATNTWTTLAAMPTPRHSPACGVINGKLWVAGGWGGSGPISAVEIYDPATNSWTNGCALSTPRYTAPGAVVGSALFALTGITTARTATVEAVNMPWQCWATQPNAPVARSAASAAALGGRIYLAGGHDGATDRNTLHSYDPATASWSSHAAMPQGRYETSGAVAFGGKVWVVGGWTTSPPLPHNEVFAYDPATNSWSNPTNLPVLSGCGAAAEIGGKLYVATPCDGYSGYRRFLHAFDPASNTWTQLANSLFEHVDPAAGAINGSFYVAGGVSIAGIHGNLERFDPATNTWTTLAAMPTPRHSPACGVINGKLWVAGGWGGSGPISAVEIYDPATNSWTNGCALSTPRYTAPGAVVGSALFALTGITTARTATVSAIGDALLVRSLGFPCQCAASPSLQSTPLVINTTATIGLSGALGNSFMLIAFNAGIPAPLTIGACALTVDPANLSTSIAGVTTPAGTWSMPVAVPANTALAGLQLAAQALVFHAGGPFLGLGDLSNGLGLTIGL